MFLFLFFSFSVFVVSLSLKSCGIHKLKAIGLDKFMELSRKESMEREQEGGGAIEIDEK